MELGVHLILLQSVLNFCGLNEKIEHIELPHEQESIEQFFAQTGISRDT